MAWPTEGPNEWQDQDLVTAALLNQELRDPLNYLYDDHPPKRAMMWHMNSLVTNGNGIAVTVATDQPFNHHARQDSPADDDEFTQSFFLQAGTYTLKLLGRSDALSGKVDWYLDDEVTAFEAGQDWYSSGGVANVVKEVTNVQISEGGVHVLKGVVNGKNASSSNYGLRLTAMWFEPSSD